MKKWKNVKECKLIIAEKWNNSYLVCFPVSYRYNGGFHEDGIHYDGYKVPEPKVPKGFELVSIAVGLQLNAHPPYATYFLKPIDGRKVKKSELKEILKKEGC